jgi:hypothetical protein
MIELSQYCCSTKWFHLPPFLKISARGLSGMLPDTPKLVGLVSLIVLQVANTAALLVHSSWNWFSSAAPVSQAADVPTTTTTSQPAPVCPAHLASCLSSLLACSGRFEPEPVAADYWPLVVVVLGLALLLVLYLGLRHSNKKGKRGGFVSKAPVALAKHVESDAASGSASSNSSVSAARARARSIQG